MEQITIQQGQTLGGIAQARGVTVGDLLKANPNIKDPNLIITGQKLTVPGSSLAGGATPAAPGVQVQGRTPTVMDTSKVEQKVANATNQIGLLDQQMQQRTAQNRVVGTPEQELNLLAQEQADMFKTFQDKMTAFEQGAIPLTSDEQASLNAIQGAFNEARKSQLIANSKSEMATNIMQNRTGRSRFAPEIAQGERESSINASIDKLKNLDVQAAGALGDAKIAIKQRNFENILKSQAKLEDSLAQRQKTFQDIRNAALENNKFMESKRQFNLEFGLKQQKAAADLEKLNFEISQMKGGSLSDPNKYEYGTPAYYLAVMGNSQGKKENLTTGERQQIADGLSALKGVKDLSTTIQNLPSSRTGPVGSRVDKIAALLGDPNSSARQINAQLNKLLPKAARGVFGEVGVLTDTDLNRYRSTLPSQDNYQGQNLAVAQLFNDYLGNAMGTQFNVYAKSGIDVSDFMDDYTNLALQVYGDQAGITSSGLQINDQGIVIEDADISNEDFWNQ